MTDPRDRKRFRSRARNDERRILSGNGARERNLLRPVDQFPLEQSAEAEIQRRDVRVAEAALGVVV